MIWSWLIAQAQAGVVVEDDRRCLDEERIDLELRAVLGDRQVDELDVFVRLDGPFESAWQVRLRVAREGVTKWQRSMSVLPADCPYLPPVIARRVEQGLAGIPAWQLSTSSHLPTEWSAYTSLSLPAAPHATLGGGLVVGLRDRWLWLVDLEAYAMSVSLDAPVGTGPVQGGRFWGGVVGSGLGLHLGRERRGVRISLGASGGPFLATGNGFEEPEASVVPRVLLNAQVSALWGPFRVGARATVPVVRVQGVAPQTQRTAPEPWFRLGLVLGVGGPVRARRR